MLRFRGIATACALALLLQAQTPSPPPTTAVDPFCVNCSYAGMKLPSANFSGGIVVGGNFQDADLRNANFRSVKFVAANFLNADLTGAAFDNAECTACNFLGAKLDGATFTGVRMVAANLKGFAAKLENAQLRALLSGCIVCNFAQSNLAARDLSGASLVQIDLTGADLRRTNFTNATLCRYQSGSSTPICDRLQDAKTDGAVFANVQACRNPLSHTGCVPIDAATLQQALHPSPSPSPS
jgi:uncharacterized protein YjbI with pentapeptide repeats